MKQNMSVYKVKTICHVQLQLVSLSAPFDFVCMLVVCNLHSCMPHTSLIVHDVFMQFYRKV